MRREELQELTEHFHAHFQPAGAMETLLVDRIVSNVWRLRRVLKVQGLIQENRMTAHTSVWYLRPVGQNPVVPFLQGENYPYRLSAIMEEGAKLSRYESFLERSVHKNLHELQRLQAARAGVPVPLPLAVDVDVLGVGSKAAGGRQNGFVP